MRGDNEWKKKTLLILNDRPARPPSESNRALTQVLRRYVNVSVKKQRKPTVFTEKAAVYASKFKQA